MRGEVFQGTGVMAVVWVPDPCKSHQRGLGHDTAKCVRATLERAVRQGPLLGVGAVSPARVRARAALLVEAVALSHSILDGATCGVQPGTYDLA